MSKIRDVIYGRPQSDHRGSFTTNDIYVLVIKLNLTDIEVDILYYNQTRL
jgi:hypothetical protein